MKYFLYLMQRNYNYQQSNSKFIEKIFQFSRDIFKQG